MLYAALLTRPSGCHLLALRPHPLATGPGETPYLRVPSRAALEGLIRQADDVALALPGFPSAWLGGAEAQPLVPALWTQYGAQETSP